MGYTAEKGAPLHRVPSCDSNTMSRRRRRERRERATKLAAKLTSNVLVELLGGAVLVRYADAKDGAVDAHQVLN